MFEIINLEITSLSHEGRGIGHLDGKTVFVSGALPGETVAAEITKKHSRYLEARAVEIIKSSPTRTTPLCQHFGICGGCSLQHLAHAEQLKHKEKILLEHLDHFGAVGAPNNEPTFGRTSQGLSLRSNQTILPIATQKEEAAAERKDKNALTFQIMEPICNQKCAGTLYQSDERRLGQELAVGWVKSERQRARTQHSSLDPTNNYGINTNPKCKGYNYRRRARLSVKFVQKKEKLLVGFHETDGRFVNDTNICPILAQPLSDQIPLLATMIRKLSIYAQIPQIEIAVTAKCTALVIRCLSEPTLEDIAILKEAALLNNWQIYLQPKDVASIKLLPGLETFPLSYQLSAYNLELLFNPTDFIQINSDVNELMIARVIKLMQIKSSDKILDLFCGLGNFTLPLARFAEKVVGVEGETNLVSRAKMNAEHNKITNAEFFVADLAQDISDAPWSQNKYDQILLDPPRVGAEAIIKHLPKLKARQIVYISCNSATLARDAKILQESGYRLIKTGLIDMFPHTSHAEAVAVFVKK